MGVKPRMRHDRNYRSKADVAALIAAQSRGSRRAAALMPPTHCLGAARRARPCGAPSKNRKGGPRSRTARTGNEIEAYDRNRWTFPSLHFRLSNRPANGEETRAAAAARRAADARFRDSAAGMLETAQDLLSNASQMSDANDRKMMLRLAAEFERRAKEKRSRRF